MAKLTDGGGGTIAKAGPPTKGQRFIFDDHRDAPRGFALRITAAGGRAFILKYTFDGKQRRKTIGAWPTWSLAAARDEANALTRRIDGGVDPIAAERQRKADPTVGEAIDLYLSQRVASLKSGKAITRYLKQDLKPLHRYKVADIRRRDIIEVVEAKAADTPTAARHLLAYCKTLLDWAVDREYIEMSPAASIRPKSIAPGGRKNKLATVKRRRVLDHEEIAAFWANAEDCVRRQMALALKLVLVTGQRPGEVAGMHRDEISGRTWTIPAARRLKTETDQAVPLTKLAEDLIAEALAEVGRLSKRRGYEPSGLVFETRPGQPLTVSAFGQAARRHAKGMKNADKATWGHWRPHDLRRTARTEIAACGFPAEVAERVIGHVAPGIEDVYNVHRYEAEKRAALEAWERRLLQVVKAASSGGSKVVAINGGACNG